MTAEIGQNGRHQDANMTSFSSGWVIWNSGSITNPNFVPKQIYPPALQIAELTETVYATQAECETAIMAGGGPHNYSAATKSGGLGSTIGGVGSAAQATHTGIDAVGAFFNRLTEANTWLRIAEGALGIILIAVALAKLTGADNAIAKTAKTAAKAAVL